MGATNPYIAQGTLNRLRCSIIVPTFPNLNITSPYMGKSFAKVTFDEGPVVDQIPTATGIVNSAEPYQLATVTVGILRTLALAQMWMDQIKSIGIVGRIEVHSDAASFSEIIVHNSSIVRLDPNAFDGKDPVAMLTIRGVFYTNDTLWQLL